MAFSSIALVMTPYPSLPPFSKQGATVNTALLVLSGLGLVIPAAFSMSVEEPTEENEGDILLVSRISAIILLALYAQLMYFQLKTHTDIFESEEDDDDHMYYMAMSRRKAATTASVASASSVTPAAPAPAAAPPAKKWKLSLDSDGD